MVPSLPPVLSLDPTANQFRLIYSTAIYHKLFHGAICAISSIDIWQPGPSSTSGSKSGLTPAAQVMGPSGGTSTSWEESSASSSLVWVQNASKCHSARATKKEI